MMELRVSPLFRFERNDIKDASDRMQEEMQADEAYLVPALGPIADGYLGLSSEEDIYHGVLTFQPYQHLVDGSGLEMEREEGSVQENVGISHEQRILGQSR